MKHFKSLLLITVFALGLGFFGIAHASSVYTDSFDTYSNGNLDTQGSWTAIANHTQVVGSGCYSGHHCITNNGTYNVAEVAFTTDNNGSGSGTGVSGTEVAWFKIHTLPKSGDNLKIMSFCYHYGCPQFYYINHAGDLHSNAIDAYYSGAALKTSVPLDTWFQLTTTWQPSSSGSDPYNWWSSQYNNETPVGHDGNDVFGKTYNVFKFRTGEDTDSTDIGNYLSDSWGDTSYSAPPALVSFTSPTNGSTVTTDTTSLNISYSNVDPALYESLRINFHYTSNGVSTVSTGYNYPISTSSGSFTVPLSTFNFDFNGTWTATAVAIIKSPQLSDFLQTEDLSDPVGYHLIINFSSLVAPFTFSDWPTWYSANAAGGYSAPSDFGNAFVGFFTPIFQNAFGFANSVLKYFDATQAEAKGQQLGSVFPVTDAYLKKIDLFFGGFPLSAFFLFVVIVMLAIFAIRTIFKFIPFFG